MDSAAQPFRVFINYRRSDSGGYAGRIYDALRAHSTEWQVFMDIDAIDPGADFTEVIDESLETCDAVIAVIGRQWLQSTDTRGRRRLEHPDDFVRLELLAALERKVKVIPVLVQGADMPSSEDMPEVLLPLARRQGLELSDGRWHYDMTRLIEVLENYHQGPAPTAVAAPPASTPSPTPSPTPAPESEPEPPRAAEPEPPSVHAPSPAPVAASAAAETTPHEAGVGRLATLAFAGAAVAFAANFLHVWYSDTLLRTIIFTSPGHTFWWGLQFFVVPLAAALSALLLARHRIRPELAVGLVIGFGLGCLVAGIRLLGAYSATGAAGWAMLVAAALFIADGALEIRASPASYFGKQTDPSSASRSSWGTVVVVVGSVLCVLGAVMDVYPYYSLIDSHWFAIEPLAGAVAAVACLAGTRSDTRRVANAGLQLAIGFQLTFFYLGFAVHLVSGQHPASGAYFGLVGGIAIAVGGYRASRPETVAAQPATVA